MSIRIDFFHFRRGGTWTKYQVSGGLRSFYVETPRHRFLGQLGQRPEYQFYRPGRLYKSDEIGERVVPAS